MSNARSAVELAARDSYGTVVAWLTARCGDLSIAEDAIGEALEAALRQWPVDGTPVNPEAWLLAVARRRLVDYQRRERVRIAAQQLLREAEEWTDSPFTPPLPDRRLGLMLACAHEQIEPHMRAPLMLNVVLGLDAKMIAASFLIKPATMAQRLVRAKRRIEQAGLTLETQDRDLFTHIGSLLEAVYAAYGAGWQHGGGCGDLTIEAIFLGRLLCDLVPASADAKGLLALMLYAESRANARRHENRYVPLEEQDVAFWDHDMIAEAEQTLRAAAQAGQPGQFQLEAAIQSIHAHRAVSGQTDWHCIARLYSILAVAYPSLGASIGWAAALSRIGACDRGLEILSALPPERVAHYQPYWAVRAHILAGMRHAQAAAAYERAIGLSDDPATRAWLLAQSSLLHG